MGTFKTLDFDHNKPENEPWPTDYKEFAERLMNERQGYALMLTQCPLGFPEPLKKMLITMNYASRAGQERCQREQEDAQGFWKKYKDN